MSSANNDPNYICIINVYFDYRAADWKLDQPDWTGRMRVCSKGNELYVKLEDNTNGAYNMLLIHDLGNLNQEVG